MRDTFDLLSNAIRNTYVKYKNRFFFLLSFKSDEWSLRTKLNTILFRSLAYSLYYGIKWENGIVYNVNHSYLAPFHLAGAQVFTHCRQRAHISYESGMALNIRRYTEVWICVLFGAHKIRWLSTHRAHNTPKRAPQAIEFDSIIFFFMR